MSLEEEEEEDSFLKLVELMKVRVSRMEKRNGVKPTFNDYVGEMLVEGVISSDNIYNQIEGHAMVWRGARLGETHHKRLISELDRAAVFALRNKSKVKESGDNVEECKTEEKQVKISEDDVVIKGGNKFFDFIQSLFKKIDDDIVELFQRVGLLYIAGIALMLFVILFLADLFGEEINYYVLLIFISIGVVFYILLKIQSVAPESKLSLVISYVFTFLIGVILISTTVLGRDLIIFFINVFD
ncbi:hypothetical protein [Formosa sp. L2A11]|uniref:hypothetical protein n=1 Tax=Formosa sp. L2A11 TaxID=2686363 RepID=UPI00131DFB49|nr:hypothetical protein [Formosa sp. L2A11]